MSATGLEVFDSTLQKTNIWLKELMEEMGLDRRKAYQALRGVYMRYATASPSKKWPNSERSCPCSFEASIMRAGIRQESR
jgi:hypothetical protein